MWRAMENVADADAMWLDARIRTAWDALVFSFERPESHGPERFEPVEIAVLRNEVRVSFRALTFSYPLKAAYAKIYRQMDRSIFLVHFRDCLLRFARFVAQALAPHVAADEAALVATPVYSSSEPLAHWLPRETIRRPEDERRMARALGRWREQCDFQHGVEYRHDDPRRAGAA